MKISEKGNMKGYDFRTWLKRNKKDLKSLASIILGLGVALTSKMQPLWAGFFGAFFGVVTRLVLDAIDFWLSDVEIESKKKK